MADLYKTIINLTGATVSAGFGTHSYGLKDYLLDTPPLLRRTIPRRYNFTQKFTNGAAHATISNGIYKLNFQSDNPNAWELFNIVTDPTESNNLYGNPAYAGAEAELMNEIEKRQKNPTDTTW